MYVRTYVCTYLHMYCMHVVLSLDNVIQLDAAVNWVKANAGQTGLYRVNYGMSDWMQFVSMLRSDHTVRCV